MKINQHCVANENNINSKDANKIIWDSHLILEIKNIKTFRKTKTEKRK